MTDAACSMPVTRSPSLVTTSPARRPFHAMPWSKMWPRPSHWVEHCSGIAITSSAPPMPCGKPWLPRSASMPVSVIVCTGLVRRRQPFCGPFVSNDCESETTRPSAHEGGGLDALGASSMKLSVPSTSSSPQRPQLRNASARAAISPSGSVAVEVGGVLGCARRSCIAATQRTHLGAEARDRAGHDVAVRRNRFQCWPLPAGLPVSRRSPGQERHGLRGARDERGDVEQQVVGRSVLHDLAVQLEAHVQRRRRRRTAPARGTGRSAGSPGAFLERYQSVPISFMSLRNTRSRVVMSFTIV